MSKTGTSVLPLALLVAAAGCASSSAVPRPFPRPGEAPPAVETAGPPDAPAEAYAIVGTALDLRGVPYRNGGSDPGGFDCSGFVWYVFTQHGIAMPRTVTEQYHAGRAIRAEAIAPGDLVFFSTVAPGASHVGLAIGGDRFVHAPSSSGEVRVEHLSAEYWSRRFVGARRLE